MSHDTENVWKRQLAQATEALGYVRRPPASPRAFTSAPAWMSERKPAAEDPILERIMEEQWPVASLREQIRRLGVQPQGRSRLDLATQLVETFMDPERLRRAVRALSDVARRYYALLLLKLRLPSVFNLQLEALSRLPGTPEFGEDLLDEIVEVGLALEDEEGYLIIPEALIIRMPPLYLEISDALLAEPPAKVESPDPLRFARQLQQLLGIVRSGENHLRPQLSWGKQKSFLSDRRLSALPTPEDARKLPYVGGGERHLVTLMAPEPVLASETLSRWAEVFGGDPLPAELLYHLLRTLNILRPGSPITLEPQHAERFLALTPGRQVALLLDYYIALSNYGLFWPAWRAGRVRVTWDYHKYHGLYDYHFVMARTLSSLRRTLLEVLALLPAETWLSFDEVVELAVEIFNAGADPAFPTPLHLGDTLGRLKGFLRCHLHQMIVQLLWRLGLSDVARDESGTLRSFRLHALQDLLWHRQEALPLPAVEWDGEKNVRWLAGLPGLALVPPVPVEVLRHVQSWAVPRGVEENALRYQLDLRRLHASFEAGETSASLRAAWSAAVGTAPPAPLVEWWERWWASYGHVQLYPRQALLEVRDEFAMQELQVALPALRDALLAQLTPHTALLHRERVQALVEQLEDKGYMPKVITTDATEGSR
ncbi:MAG: hypothetical protein ACP5HM_12225 [Anaerolineae bacterium]